MSRLITPRSRASFAAVLSVLGSMPALAIGPRSAAGAPQGAAEQGPSPRGRGAEDELGRAAEPDAGPSGDATATVAEIDGDLDPDTLARYRKLLRPPGIYGRLGALLTFGRGLRFNNPYRLQTQLGESAESLSLTATYVDVAVDMAFGDPAGLQHGAALHMTAALEGVSQQALSLSYVLGHRGDGPWSVWGRLGPSVLLAPDANLGGELGVGGAYFITGLIGLTAEIVGNLYYGAGTWEVEYTTYPILSLQGGLIAEWEVLP